MSTQPGVSIIVNCYNYDRFIEAAIDSALAQDHRPLQVIVVDDGSTDGSWALIQGYGACIEARRQDNQGQGAACLHGLSLARHEIVVFLDADDILEPHAARTIVEAWGDGVSKVQYCLAVIDEHGVPDGNVFPKFGKGLSPEAARAEIFRTGSYPDSPTSGNAYARDFAAAVLPLVAHHDSFDGELNGLAPLYGDVISLDRPLARYRIHGSNKYAQGALAVERFSAYLRSVEHRTAFLREHYRSKGQTIGQDVLDHDLKYLEYALVVEKLDRKEGPGRRGVWSVAALAIRAALRSPYSPMHKAVRIAWLCALAAAPRGLSSFLVEQRFIPARRIALLTWLATWRQRPRPPLDGSVSVL
ncbi:MAG: glycosyltransferase [Alphaproteobacteria bacterium]